jgi:hypothetical protein
MFSFCLKQSSLWKIKNLRWSGGYATIWTQKFCGLHTHIRNRLKRTGPQRRNSKSDYQA